MMLVYSGPAWPPALNSVFNHVWQSSLFAVVVALLSLALRKNHARWRCRLWLAGSIKFLVPFSVLVGIGAQFGWRTQRLAVQPGIAYFMDEITRTLAQPVVRQTFAVTPAVAFSVAPAILLGLWFCGCVAVLLRWSLRWRLIRATVRAAVPLTEGREWEALCRVQRFGGDRHAVQLLRFAHRLEPGIFGILHPVLLWPAGISDRLAGAQLDAIIAHELCHVRRRDNLAAALHMAVEAIFWFHPLVWWLGARLIAERENACDEEVLHLGSEPRVYAESILKTCRFCMESPLACMAGVTGANLKKRIERIMTQRAGRQLNTSRKLLLAAAGTAAVVGPVAFGVFSAPAGRAQSQAAARPEFEVASIKPNTSGDHRVSFQITPGGRLACTNATAKILITMAYGLKPHQLEGGPNWLDTERYDITAKGEGGTDRDDLKLMMQGLLADRFKLKFHRETKELPVYALVVGKSGPKLHATEASGGEMKQFQRMGRGQIELQGANMGGLADALSSLVGRNVLDKTGISGNYDIKLEWTPDESESPMLKGPPDGKAVPAPPAPEATGPSVFTAIQEQLGLKLEAQKGPVEVTIIDHIEKATEN
jgi:bla regulator protein blaR1